MIKTIAERLGAILAALDALSEANGAPEALEDLNAEFEDALLMLAELSERDEGWQEELSDALEDFRALAGDYRALAAQIPGVQKLAAALEQAASDAP